MNISEFMPKQTFTLEDLKNGDLHRIISKVEQRQFEFGGRPVVRLVLHFEIDHRVLILNTTNLNAVAETLAKRLIVGSASL